jgi:hypothetical protein
MLEQRPREGAQLVELGHDAAVQIVAAGGRCCRGVVVALREGLSMLLLLMLLLLLLLLVPPLVLLLLCVHVLRLLLSKLPAARHVRVLYHVVSC